MKEQEVFCFLADQRNENLTDTINEHIALLNAQGKRVVNIGFPHSPFSNTTGVCLFCEKE